MNPRLNAQPAVVDARDFCDPDVGAWIAPGPVPSVFEFARACGSTGLLSREGERAANVRIVAVLYLGGGLFDGPGAGRARFDLLLRARRRLMPASYRFEIPRARFPALEQVPIHAVPSTRARELAANHYFLVR